MVAVTFVSGDDGRVAGADCVALLGTWGWSRADVLACWLMTPWRCLRHRRR